MSSPVEVWLNKGKKLHLWSLPMSQGEVDQQGQSEPNRGPPAIQASGGHGAKRQGLYIEVTGGQTAARIVPVADGQATSISKQSRR